MNGSIISADSVQQYIGMDIGSAKVAKKYREEIPHYCIDIAPIGKTITVADFAVHAHAALSEIIRQGRTPIIVGGSGFYIRWLLRPPQSEITTAMQQLASDLVADTSASWFEKLSRPSVNMHVSGRQYLLNLIDQPRADMNPSYIRHHIELVLAAGGQKPKPYEAPTTKDVRG